MTTTNLFDNSGGGFAPSVSPFKQSVSNNLLLEEYDEEEDEELEEEEGERESSAEHHLLVNDVATGTPTVADTAAATEPEEIIPPTAESTGDMRLLPDVEKPQVIVRIRPSPNIEIPATFEVDQAAKLIQIRFEKERRTGEVSAIKQPPGFIYFPADEILENSSQEDTFKTVALSLVEKAMMGRPGMIVATGPEASGKSFSLFGLSGRYRNRGVAARTLEKMFQIKERKQSETVFKFGIGIVEIRRDKIRDLLTLSPNEINEVTDRGPKGMYVEEVDTLEQGLGLLLRALIGQKLIHKETYERFHTIVYFEILALSPLTSELIQFQSRITLVEIAAAPSRSSTMENPQQSFQQSCFMPPQPKAEQKFKQKQQMSPSSKCCHPGTAAGPLGESIAVRRDVFALEQIFLKANELFRAQKYFSKIENLGLSMVAAEKRKLSSGHNFRHNRLAFCLKDILRADIEIRIILHVRPDRESMKSSLEAMRFAARCRLVPSNMGGDNSIAKPGRTDDQILQEMIAEIAPELMHPAATMESLSSEKMKVIQDQAIQYFENSIDSMKICTREKVKILFENFRVLWNFLWELELNLTMKRMEAQMIKPDVEKLEDIAETEGDEKAKSRHSVDLPDAEEDQPKKPKKSIKDKKEKKKKDKKRNSNSNRNSKDNPPDDKTDEVSPKRATMKEDVKAPQEAEVIAPKDTDAGGNIQEAARDKKPESPPGLLDPDGGLKSRQGPDTEEGEEEDLLNAEDLEEEMAAVLQEGEVANPASGRVTRHNSALFGKGGLMDHNMNTGGETKGTLTDEELEEKAFQQEQQISSNFEEMKRVARRQAIHLLRTGIRRPQWMNLF